MQKYMRKPELLKIGDPRVESKDIELIFFGILNAQSFETDLRSLF